MLAVSLRSLRACKTTSWANLLKPGKRSALGFIRDRTQFAMNYPVVLGVSCTSTHERATALRFVALSYLPNLLFYRPLASMAPMNHRQAETLH
jgi:hypothetical protein